MSKSEIYRKRVQNGERPSQDVPELHGNPNDLSFNPEYVFQLKEKLALAEITEAALAEEAAGHKKCIEENKIMRKCLNDMNSPLLVIKGDILKPSSTFNLIDECFKKIK